MTTRKIIYFHNVMHLIHFFFCQLLELGNLLGQPSLFYDSTCSNGSEMFAQEILWIEKDVIL